jgi:hypothetical protein
MMKIVDVRFALHIMNMHSDRQGTFMMWIMCEMSVDFLLSVFVRKNISTKQ